MWYPTDDMAYVDSRLRGTVVVTPDGEPIQVIGLDRDRSVREKRWLVTGQTLKDHDIRNVKLEELNPSSPRLGFTNYEGRAFYLGRIPKRRDWRQGLRRENMFAMRAVNKLRNYDFNSYVPLLVPLTNKYPAYHECLERVEDIYDSVAFSPLFAVDNHRKLYYKNQQVVGVCEDDKPKLEEDFFWLHETLESNLKGEEDDCSAFTSP